ncbi:MAG TPA: hypothetical protein EYO80_02720, partial [Candidatus Marinimicrobia bacterium]|nr:hypothetical protein [Candidatus Neomarinimicrobiota bacterium]
MKIILTLFSLILFSCRPPDQTQAMTMNDISIIPQPSSTQILNTAFDLKSIKGIVLKNGSSEERQIAELFQNLLEPVTVLSISEFISTTLSGALDHIIISLDDNSEIPAEGYKLAVGEH